MILPQVKQEKLFDKKRNETVSFVTVSKTGHFFVLLKKEEKIETHFFMDHNATVKVQFKNIADDYCTSVITYEVFILISTN